MGDQIHREGGISGIWIKHGKLPDWHPGTTNISCGGPLEGSVCVFSFIPKSRIECLLGGMLSIKTEQLTPFPWNIYSHGWLDIRPTISF